MKQILFTLMFAAVVGLTTAACAKTIVPSKKYVTKTVKVDRFDAIATGCAVDVVYTQASGTRHVEIYAPDNLIEYIDVCVKNGVLKVGFKTPYNNFSITGRHTKEVRVSAPAVNSLNASSSGDIILKNGLRASGIVRLNANSSGDIKGGAVVCDELVASASSSGDVVLDKVECETLKANANSSGDVSIKGVSAAKVEANANSSGDVILTGTCQSAILRSSSSGDLDAKGLKAVDVTASANSSGEVSCYATGTLDAKISSSGEVFYKGDPKHIEYAPKKGLRKID